MSKTFDIRKDYNHRPDNNFFDDTPLKDEWQKEVYEKARAIADRIRAKSVVDVGCGSGFKLMTYFGHLKTVGVDLEPTLSFLKTRYPDRDWRESDFSKPIEPADLVICSDVVEHIPDPDVLMAFLQTLRCKVLVISTPDRELAYGFDHAGPPNNQAHCREWTRREFKSYVSRWFVVVESCITNVEQATQAVVCRPKRRGFVGRLVDLVSA